MKTTVVVILVLIAQLNVFAQKHENYKNEKDLGLQYEEKFVNKYNERYDEDEDPGNPDNHEIIERPCQFFDIFCIRKFFAAHSNCKIVPGPVREPFYLAEDQLNLINNNVSVTLTATLMRGFDGRIDEFYVNKETGNLILSVYFEDIKVDAKRTFFRFNRNGEEPVETMAEAAIDYLQLTVTTIFPNVKNLRLEDAEVNGYLDNPLPPFIIGPGVVNSKDPTVVAELGSLLADIPTAAIENLPTVAPRVAKIFIQGNICDFGVPINRI